MHKPPETRFVNSLWENSFIPNFVVTSLFSSNEKMYASHEIAERSMLLDIWVIEIVVWLFTFPYCHAVTMQIFLYLYTHFRPLISQPWIDDLANFCAGYIMYMEPKLFIYLSSLVINNNSRIQSRVHRRFTGKLKKLLCYPLCSSKWVYARVSIRVMDAGFLIPLQLKKSHWSLVP